MIFARFNRKTTPELWGSFCVLAELVSKAPAPNRNDLRWRIGPEIKRNIVNSDPGLVRKASPARGFHCFKTEHDMFETFRCASCDREVLVGQYGKGLI